MLLLQQILALSMGIATALASPIAPAIDGRSAATTELLLPQQVSQTVLDLTGFARQTEAEAAKVGRQMLDERGTGTLATTYPLDRTDGLAGSPLAMMEYQVPHPKDRSALLIIFMPISQNTRNVLADPRRRATFELQNEAGRMAEERLSLIGHIVVERNLTAADDALYSAAYLKQHPDALPWLPSAVSSPHTAFWARLEPDAIFHVGGFGDVKHIGYIPLDVWRDAVER